MEVRLELRAIICLDDVDSERQTLDYRVDELDGGLLVAGIVDFQDSYPRAVVDSRELIQPLF